MCQNFVLRVLLTIFGAHSSSYGFYIMEFLAKAMPTNLENVANGAVFYNIAFFFQYKEAQ